MKLLSWLCGSMSVAFLMAGFLLLVQPKAAQAAGAAPCINCTADCKDCNTAAKCTVTAHSCTGGGVCGASCTCSDWVQITPGGSFECHCN